jgi:uncharacterized membrane protein HdeD (DUF308 family)
VAATAVVEEVAMAVAANGTALPVGARQSDHWWVFLLQGLAGIVLGVMLLAMPGAAMVAIVTFLGFYWFVTGLLSLVQMFVDRSVPWIWSLLAGVLGTLAGVFVLRHPLLAALTVPAVLVVVLGIQGIAMGALQIAGAVKGGGAAAFLLGSVNAMVGLLLLASPFAASFAVPVVFGFLLLVQGIGLVLWAFRLRR